jgi:hypothetical protein
MNRLSWVRCCVLGSAFGSLAIASTAGSAPYDAPSNAIPSNNVIYSGYGKDGKKGGNVEFEWKVEEGESYVIHVPSIRLLNAVGGVIPPTSPGGSVEPVFDINYAWDWEVEAESSLITTGSGGGTAAGSRLFVGGLSFQPDGTALYDTELLALNLVGSGGLPPGFSTILLRESPTRASLGKTSIASQPGGTYRIDSFFDVFTEISLDGGQHWAPALSSVRLESLPEPSACALAALGLISLAAGRRRRNR